MCKNNKHIKVRDHCHILHTYNGFAYQDCNPQYNMKKSSWKLPVFFHNLPSYDQHMLICALENHVREKLESFRQIWTSRRTFVSRFHAIHVTGSRFTRVNAQSRRLCPHKIVFWVGRRQNNLGPLPYRI